MLWGLFRILHYFCSVQRAHASSLKHLFKFEPDIAYWVYLKVGFVTNALNSTNWHNLYKSLTTVQYVKQTDKYSGMNRLLEKGASEIYIVQKHENSTTQWNLTKIQ